METKKTKLVYSFLLFLLIVTTPAKAQHVLIKSELQDLLNDAVLNSKLVQIQQQNAQQATNNRSKALKTYLPTVGLTSSFVHLNDDISFSNDLESLLMATQKLVAKEQLGIGFNSALPPNIPLTEVEPFQAQNIFRATVKAEMILFTGFRVPMLAKAAEHQQKVYEAMGTKEATAVIQETIRMYKSLALIHKSEKVLSNSELRLEEQSRYVTKAVKKGLATELEESRIELARQELQQKRIDLNTKKQMALTMLEQLTGIHTDSLSRLTPVLNPLILEKTAADVVNRPELRALSEAETASTYKMKSAYSAYLPKVKLFGQRELYEDDLSLFDPAWLVGIGVQWNIFDGLKRSEDIQNAKLNVSAISLQKQQTEELLTVNLKKANLDLAATEQHILVARKQQNTAQKTYNIVEKQYKVGLAPQRDYLEAENELQQAELAVSKAIFEQNMAAVNYMVAGGTLQNLTGQQ